MHFIRSRAFLILTKTKLTLLFDGGCPLCRREVKFLRSRDINKSISFIDIDSSSYDPKSNKGITYREAMGRIHAIDSSGEILKDIEVFREAYKLIGLGWIYAPTTWPCLKRLSNWLYQNWAYWRLSITRRKPLDELCQSRELHQSNL